MSISYDYVIREIEYLTEHPDSYEKYRNSCTAYRELLCEIVRQCLSRIKDKEEEKVICKIIKIIRDGKCGELQFERMISELIMYDFNQDLSSEKDWDVLLYTYLSYEAGSEINTKRVNEYIRHYLAVNCSIKYYNYIEHLDSLKKNYPEKYKDIDPDHLAKGYFDMMRLISSFECDPEKAIVVYNN